MAVELAWITGVGAVTPIGFGAWKSAAAARAGVCGFREHPYMIDSAGEPIRVARVPWLDVDVDVDERLAQMLFAVIDEALREAPDLRQVAVAIGLPSPRPGLPVDVAAVLRHRVVERFEERITQVLIYEAGHAAGLLALDAGVKGIGNRSIEACVVAGVDSYMRPETLEWIEDCDQLHGGGRLNNAWGFIPGEAAGALLVETATAAQRAGRLSLAAVLGIGVDSETHLIKADSVCMGKGLTQAFRKALTRLGPEERIDNVFCDLNGEAYRADEYGLTCLRTKERFREATDFVAPADCWGDVGAAGGPLHVLLAIAACRKGYGKGRLSMVWSSSEGGERAACVLAARLSPRE